jgi:hypothetical protein
MNYLIISLLIVTFMALEAYAAHQYRKSGMREQKWYKLWLGTMVLEAYARAARAMGKYRRNG